MKLTGWGNYPRVDVNHVQTRSRADVVQAVADSSTLIARGNGRAYGDAALNPTATVSMLAHDRILDFDPVTGLLTCEAGLLLADVVDIFLPRGWFVPVTPGTKFVTIGGMVAADVHGKNHHRAGSFGAHVEAMDILLADGRVVHCTRDVLPDLFMATCGGMGLTGVILTVAFRLIPVETAYVRQQTERAGNLEEAMEMLANFSTWTYSVAWIDCLARGDNLGRSLIYSGEHAQENELPAALRENSRRMPPKTPKRVPFYLPNCTLNAWSVRAFNHMYYTTGRCGSAFVDCDSFFYPLDAIQAWNRIYGKAGFVQYQCVLPQDASPDGLPRLIRKIAGTGQGSFLAVLKLFGDQEGLLSFPMRGFTLALDFRVNGEVFALLRELDAIVIDHGGRIYLAKDARAEADVVHRGYPRLSEFLAVRAKYDPAHKFSSLQSRRLTL